MEGQSKSSNSCFQIITKSQIILAGLRKLLHVSGVWDWFKICEKQYSKRYTYIDRKDRIESMLYLYMTGRQTAIVYSDYEPGIVYSG